MTRNESFVPVELLRQLVDLDIATGRLTWRERSADLFTASSSRTAAHIAAHWNSRYAGTPALSSVDASSHLAGRIFNRMIYAHRAVYAIVHGAWPEQTIDHINGDGADNRPCNLRDVSHAENQRNQRRPKNNSTGDVGVYRVRSGKWVAAITVSKQNYHLGSFDSKAEALAARNAASARFGFHRNHGRAAS